MNEHHNNPVSCWCVRRAAWIYPLCWPLTLDLLIRRLFDWSIVGAPSFCFPPLTITHTTVTVAWWEMRHTHHRSIVLQHATLSLCYLLLDTLRIKQPDKLPLWNDSVRYAPYKVHRVKPFPRDEYHSLIDGELSACHAIMLIIYTDELGVVCYDWSIDWVLTAGDLYTLLLYFLIFVIVQAVLFSYDYAVTDEKATFIKQLSWTPPFQVSTH